MEKAYEYRIYPTEEQRELIVKTFGCARYVYNKALELQQSSDTTLSLFVLNNYVNQLKKQDATAWLKEPDKFSLTYSVKALVNAISNHRKNPKHFNVPHFKKRKYRQSYKTSFTNNNIAVLDGAVKLPKLGRVKAAIHRPITGRIINATIKQVPSGKYFISICTTDNELPIKKELNNAVGLDVGIKDFATDSNGNAYGNKHFYKSCENKLKQEHRKLSRKQKDSKNWNKQRIKLAKIYETIANKRKDYIHKITSKLVDENQVICIEDINTSGLMRNSKLSKSIAEQGWYEFKRQLEYKCNWYGRSLVVIDRFYPSSKLCNNCGWKNTQLKLCDRKWTCPDCGMELDRDFNAADNVKDEGIRIYQGG